jgi:hypothetical protein
MGGSFEEKREKEEERNNESFCWPFLPMADRWKIGSHDRPSHDDNTAIMRETINSFFQFLTLVIRHRFFFVPIILNVISWKIQIDVC